MLNPEYIIEIEGPTHFPAQCTDLAQTKTTATVRLVDDDVANPALRAHHYHEEQAIHARWRSDDISEPRLEGLQQALGLEGVFHYIAAKPNGLLFARTKIQDAEALSHFIALTSNLPTNIVQDSLAHIQGNS